MAVIPNPVTYADIRTKMQEVDTDLGMFVNRQQNFVRDLSAMITYFVYSLRNVDVAAAIERAAAAGEIDPEQGAAIYRKFMDVQTALRLANSDDDKMNIMESLLRWEPVLRKLPIGDPGYNGLPGQPASQPAGYPIGRGRGGEEGGGGGGGGGWGEFGSEGSGGISGLDLPAAPTTDIKITISPADMRRKDEIIAMIDRGQRPTVTTTAGKTGDAVSVFRDTSGKPTAFRVDFTNKGVTVSQRVDLPTTGGWRIKPKRKTRQSKLGYKSRKSKRRTFR
jgi:hypothetical protein